MNAAILALLLTIGAGESGDAPGQIGRAHV